MDNYQQAYDSLIQNIYVPVFLEKLANDYGIRPSNDAEANEFLVLASKMQQIDESQQVKQAVDRSSWISTASKSLDAMITGSPVSNYRNDLEVKQAAAQLAQNANIRNAALLYQDYVRQQLDAANK